MLRGLSERQNLKVNVVMFSRHVARVTAFFERLHPGARLRVIQVDPGSVRSIFEIKACIDRGEFVGILGDRIGPGEYRSGRARRASSAARRASRSARSSWRGCSAAPSSSRYACARATRATRPS